MGNLYLSFCPRWFFNKNSQFHKGGRVVVMWNPHMFTVNILMCTNKLVHCFKLLGMVNLDSWAHSFMGLTMQ